MIKKYMREYFTHILRARVTLTLFLINTLIFIVTHSLYKFYKIDLIKHFAQYNPGHESFRFYQLISSDYIHFSIPHLVNNMYFLIMFGISLENRIKSVNYFLLYTASGLFGGIIQSYAFPEGYSAGASGAIFGIVAFHALYSSYGYRNFKLSPQIKKIMGNPIISIIVFELIFAIFSIGMEIYHLYHPLASVGHFAHVGGALMGANLFIVYTIYQKWKNPQFKPEYVYFEMEKDLREKKVE
jgi:membrane associated rhomboid family serine protease